MSTFNVTHPLKFTSHTRKQPNHLTPFFCLIFSVTNSHSHPHNLPLSSQWISTFFGNSSHVHSLNICSTLILNGTKPREKKLISAFHVNIFGAENSMRIIMREKFVFTFQPTARNYYYIKIYMWKGSKWICFVCSSLKWTPPLSLFFLSGRWVYLWPWIPTVIVGDLCDIKFELTLDQIHIKQILILLRHRY